MCAKSKMEKITKKKIGEIPMDNRRSKENYYLDIAEAALERSTCLRRQFGAIIVRDD